MLNYSDMPLDRCSNVRKDPTWFKGQMSSQSVWLLVKKNETLFIKNTPQIMFLPYEQITQLDLTNALFLGLNTTKKGVFALDVSDIDDTTLSPIISGAEFMDIRKQGPLVDIKEGSIAALARGLCYWHATHRFCGRCGSKNHLVEAGHSRLCENERCNHPTFPRTDPAVIMVVTKTFADGIERCLLGRQAVWPKGMYSSLAGFVDPGETLEQAVAREVKEEAGVEVNDVTYVASQSWPFPSSIMLGFFAKATSEQINVDKDELDDAKWFSREDLANFGNWHDEGEHLKLPRTDSISRYLIEHWRTNP
ncbi:MULTISPECIES: NAD(+) diphosphatase [unclassified Pseudoalteromonas]|uniref:NAD(+) diphosphatase n=1 Tax=unclassified Pseudoalteromonas TaxID=194690 RepID=UPI00110973A4|nr:MULTISPECIES: NAD(+) diphosphatase [unclassified Pseudoalteromonas]TMN77010.1 NAD(+) diphosphatase [Pseudoalteromonas sp. S410]TMN87705.1 NAD(+) diphosphatase [Pseudoalteromonas sp. S408]TMN95526.1 NAD(+) diphosphatase [Pseudoalteromonas sp. S407]TMN96708.1 NAD(+) diphosphatase [Pseudoalteromonas sp. S409]TMO08961.1 NAD(+) diphosphatase [Pseudoalteromonas sp. S186]